VSRIASLVCAACVAATTATATTAGTARIAIAQGPERAQSPTERQPSAAARARNPATLERGRQLYETHCASCHGPRGEGGKGPTLAQPTLSRGNDEASLLRVIREGVNGTEMPRAQMERQDVALVAAFVKSLGSLPRERVPGDPARGAQLYATKGGCAQCHTLRGQGSAFGPDLGDIGRRRRAVYLRRSLVDPGVEVPQSFSAFRQDSLPANFLYVRARTGDGREIAGVRANEDTFSIQIREASGRVHSFFKTDLAELHKDFGKSPMPSYAEALKADELDDLVAFLVSLRDLK